MTEAILEVSQLTIGWGTKTLLENLNFSVDRGEVFVILGGSGASKSTLLRHRSGSRRRSQVRFACSASAASARRIPSASSSRPSA